jgi:hypothetical protein
MRDVVAAAIDSEKTSPRDLAALTRRLMDITREIEKIDAEEEAEGGGDLDPEEDFDPEEDV